MVVAVTYGLLCRFFSSKARKAKAAGIPNRFFVGFFFMFLVLFVMQAGIAVYEAIPDAPNLQTPFPGYDALKDRVWFLYNFMRPLFVLGLLMGLGITAGMIYPLEEIVGWRSFPLTKYLLVVAAAVLVVFVPAVTFSAYTVVVLLATFVGIGFGLFFNMAVNLKLAVRSPAGSSIRRRSVAILVAFVLFYLGLVWSLEVGWTKALVPVASLKWDVVVGSALQVVSGGLYWRGFRLEESRRAS
ncbi:MAG: hypothetical protein Kow0069_35010 [Promethearchaeota archaeon]